MFAAQHVPYNQTNAFTKIVLDYLKGSEELKPFYDQPSSLTGIEETLRKKQLQPVNRKVLVQVLQEQYSEIETTATVTKNIELLLSDKTFTLTTAHQPEQECVPAHQAASAARNEFGG